MIPLAELGAAKLEFNRNQKQHTMNIQISKQKISRAGTKKQIDQYVLDCIDGSGYGVELKNDKEKIEFLLDTFTKEYCYPQNLQRYRTKQEVFRQWCMGLPSCFNIEFENYKILELGKKWSFIKEDATERQEDEFINNYWNRLYMNVMQVARKHKVK